MDKRELTYDEIMQIVKLFESSSELAELHLRFGDTILDLGKPGSAGSSFAPSAAPEVEESQPEIAETLPETPPEPTPEGGFLITSPTVGTFYRAPEPGATPFVSVGQKVEPTTTVCIIEVMKLMNALQAGCSGTVSKILVNNEEMVEFGQTLIVIETD